MRKFFLIGGAFLSAVLLSVWLLPPVGLRVVEVIGPAAVVGPVLLLFGLLTRRRHLEWAFDRLDRIVLVTVGACFAIFGGTPLTLAWCRGDPVDWWLYLMMGVFCLVGLAMLVTGLFGTKRWVESFSNGL